VTDSIYIDNSGGGGGGGGGGFQIDQIQQ